MKKCRTAYWFLQICFLLSCCLTNAQQLTPIDSAKKSITASSSNDPNFISTSFFIADNYMDIEQYDSAQVWLNKIHEKLPLKTNSLNNYFLITRQAEVYYYNNLQQLGLQESLRGLEMAKSLNDSLLLADSYNFLGLFYMNMDSASKSLPYFKSGMKYTRQPPYPLAYVSLTKPHHLYGNIAEAFSKLAQFDSALLYNKISLKLASQINWGRGIAVGHTSMGEIFFSLEQNDSAIFHFNEGIAAAKKSKDIDVELLCYGGLAKCFDKNKNLAYKSTLGLGLDILQKYPMLNRFFALQFLTTACNLFKVNGESSLLINTMELKSEIETANVKGNNSQIQTILNAGLANEKRLLSLEVDDAKQKQKLANSRLVIAIIAFAFMSIGFFVYRYYQNQKFAISKMRNKISQDLHDDIGASLSSLQIYGAVAEKTFKTNPEKAIEMLHKIYTQSKTVMENMNDIVWSMNTNNAKATSLEAKVKNYSVELLSDNNINFNCNIDASVEPMLKSITAKRNILLIIREAMNNIAKYSKATNASLQINVFDKNLEIKITDNGLGFDINNGKKGNGLENMKQRAKELNGKLDIATSCKNGTSIFITIPLKSV
jgi:signal transduction histidine kinase/Tfp pilus assembly protein PilF